MWASAGAPVYCLGHTRGHTASPGIVRDPSLQALRHHVAWLAELDNEQGQPEDERRHRDEEHAQGELLPSASRAGGVEEVATEEEGHAVQDVLQDGQLPQALREYKRGAGVAGGLTAMPAAVAAVATGKRQGGSRLCVREGGVGGRATGVRRRGGGAWGGVPARRLG